jgi:predicted small lipoprotein YifL
MQLFSRWNLLALALCAMLTLTACGQKGDLYLPEGQADQVMVG